MTASGNLGVAGVLVAGLLILTTACGVKDRMAAHGFGGEKVERTGILRISSAQECLNPDGCGPAFVLLDEAFEVSHVLEGEFDPAHDQLLIAVEGRLQQPDEHRRQALQISGRTSLVEVKRYRTLSKVPYRNLLLEQSTADSEKLFGCSILWDKRLSWRFENDQVLLIARMVDSSSPRVVKPYVEIHYDGNTGDVVGTDTGSANLDPC